MAHYNLPGSVEAYYQEAGRAGRDGKPARCVLLYEPRDLFTQKFFIDKMGENNPRVCAGQNLELLQRAARRKLGPDAGLCGFKPLPEETRSSSTSGRRKVDYKNASATGAGGVGEAEVKAESFGRLSRTKSG